MLDRSVPFYNVILKCDAYQRSDVALPQGFSFSPYRAGDEKEWARLEYGVGDFSSLKDAEDYFQRTYMREPSLLRENAVFLLDRHESVVGSCIAWRDQKEDGVVSSLHWLIVDEAYQGWGFGKALCQKTMDVFAAQNRFPVYIHTQPWSWKAILLYLSLGFRMQKTDSFSDYVNQYPDAMRTLKELVSADAYAALLTSAED